MCSKRYKLIAVVIIVCVINVLYNSLLVLAKNFDDGFCLRDEKNFVYINTDGSSVAKIQVSYDAGATWIKSRFEKVGDLKGLDNGYVSFNKDGTGCLILISEASLNRQRARIFITNDKGNSWEEIEYNKKHEFVVSGVGYSKRALFVNYRYYTDCGPDIWYTLDNGKSWQRMYVKLPEIYNQKDYRFTALSFKFNGLNGVCPIIIRDIKTEAEKTVYMYSNDGGLSWYFNK